MTSAGIDFNSGHVFQIDLAYNSSAHVLTETVTDTSTSAVFSTSYNVDIAAHLGSNVGYVGFGGGTGGETAVQDILKWQYHSGAAVVTDGGPASLAATVSSPAAADGGPALAITAAPAPAGGASAAAIAAPKPGGSPGSGGGVAAAGGSIGTLVDLAIADGDAEAPWFSLAGLTRAGRRRSTWLTTSA
jgi:hypothetical protein